MAFFNAEYGHFLTIKPPQNRNNNCVRLHFLKLKNGAILPSAWVKTRVCQILFFRQKRRYVYKDSSFADDFSSNSRRILKFFYNELTTGVEEGNLFFLSAVGELLEYKGLLRLHACGFEDGNNAFVFPGDSGFGKSTLAKDILLKTDLKIISDEMVLTDGYRFFSFPLRISLKEFFESETYSVNKWSRNRFAPKWQVQIPDQRISKKAHSGKIYLSSEMSRLDFFIRVVSGYGLPQMKEYFIRRDNILKLTKVFFQRLYFFYKLYPQVQKIEVGQRQSQKLLNLLVKSTDI